MFPSCNGTDTFFLKSVLCYCAASLKHHGRRLEDEAREVIEVGAVAASVLHWLALLLLLPTPMWNSQGLLFIRRCGTTTTFCWEIFLLRIPWYGKIVDQFQKRTFFYSSRQKFYVSLHKVTLNPPDREERIHLWFYCVFTHFEGFGSKNKKFIRKSKTHQTIVRDREKNLIQRYYVYVSWEIFFCTYKFFLIFQLSLQGIIF